MAINVVVALLYALAGKVGLWLATDVRTVTLVWPAAGLAVFALFRYGVRVLPGIAVGAALTNAISGVAPGFVAATTLGNPLEALVGWALLRRLGFSTSLGSLRDPLLLILGAAVAPAVAAFVGSTTLCLLGMEPWSRYGWLLFTWWLGDGMGILLVAPVLLTWADPEGRQAARARPAAALMQVLLVALLGYGVFGKLGPKPFAELLAFAFFPVVLFSAALLGPIGAATTLFLTAVLAVGGTFLGTGPFSDVRIGHGLLYLHGFLGTLFLTGLVPAALMWERRASEQRLRDSEAQMRSVVMSMAEGVVLQDRRGTILTANPRAEAILGLTLDQLAGRTSLDPRWRAIREDGSPFPGSEHPAMVTLKTGEPCRDVLMGVHKPDGTLRWIAINSEPVRGEGRARVSDEAPAVVATFRDVTERRMAEERQRRTERLESLGTLAGGLAHDLNNVLAPVRLGIDYIAQRVHDAGGRRMLEVMESGVERGAALVGQILAYVRGTSGGRSPLSVEEMIRDVERWIRRTFPENINIRVELGPNLGAVSADATELNQALLNLCLNARDAMPAGGELVLSATRAPLPLLTNGTDAPRRMGVAIGVTDDGPGIATELHERIFEPFFTTKTFGTGLGLAMVQSIARAHGGTVSLRSAPGTGAEFSILLPMQSDRGQGAPARIPRETERGTGELVLIVEDDAGVRDATGRLLEHAGFRVLSAVNGMEAMELIDSRSEELAVVVSDVSLPHFDGPELLRRIHARWPDLPVILVSGLPIEPVEGAFAFIQKPYAFEHLLGEIRSAAAARGR